MPLRDHRRVSQCRWADDALSGILTGSGSEVCVTKLVMRHKVLAVGDYLNAGSFLS